MKLGLFVHFGIYSNAGKGEWYMHDENVPKEEYNKLLSKFKVKKNWAKNIVKLAKKLGAKYIVLTTRHHDGFSLYDTDGLTDYDVMHTPTNRDLIKEFVNECNKENISPFFYHTLIDWHHKDFEENFDDYKDYLFKSITLLCNNYGKIGGFWFDGTWYSKKLYWDLSRLYAIIRTYQKDAIISNNGGLENGGEIINHEVDCAIFEKGPPSLDTNENEKHRAKEMCQTLNNHWGYFKTDKDYKTCDELFNDYLICKKNNANFLINIGPRGDGGIILKDKSLLRQLGKRIALDNKT